jgi:uncharacterized Zn-binding protein involved in type VI secretion
MAKLISDQGTASTCGHPQTGSSKVFIQGKGASRVGIDTAGGSILGPGASRVFIEGYNASLIGDAIAPHAPLPPHVAATTLVTQNKVFAT